MESQRTLVHAAAMKSRTLISLLVGRVLLVLVILTGGSLAQISATEEPEQRRPKLRWVFDKDPRALGLKISDTHGVIKFRMLKNLSVSIGRNGSLVDIVLQVKKEASEVCILDQGEILGLIIPNDYFRGPHDIVGKKIYDTSSLDNIEIYRDYYGIIDCANLNQLLYIEE